VVFEIKLMQAEKWAKASNCTDVEVLLTGQGPGMSLDARSARDYVKLAALEGSCRHAEKAESFLHKAAADTNPADLVWAIRAEKLLGTYDAAMADQQATHALAEAEKSLAASTHSGSWQYAAGMLQAALGRTELARGSFKQALILADDHMSHHLAREALSELSAGKERSTSETP
jgi:tetratricopeptide (TPR) repeat protein